MDQPAGLLRKMRQVNNVYQTFKVYQQEGNRPGETAKWKREHSDMWEHCESGREIEDEVWLI